MESKIERIEKDVNDERERESYVLCDGLKYIYFIFNMNYTLKKLQYFKYYFIHSKRN